MGNTKITWLGDSDPSAVMISQYGYTFVKGEPVPVPDDVANEKFAGHPLFSSEAKPAPVPADEPEPVDPDAGTAKAALKRELRARGEEVRGNPSEETLRERLAKLAAGEAA